MIDGQQRQPVKVRPGHEARLDLAGATHQASVLVILHTPDPSCRVDLGVDKQFSVTRYLMTQPGSVFMLTMRGRTGRALFTALLTLTALTACDNGGPGASSPTGSTSVFSRPGGVNVGTNTDQPGFGQLTPGGNERGGFDVDLWRWLGGHVPPIFTPIPVDLTIDERVKAL